MDSDICAASVLFFRLSHLSDFPPILSPSLFTSPDTILTSDMMKVQYHHTDWNSCCL